MSHITRDINKLLDAYSNAKLDPDCNKETLSAVTDELNKITNDGKNVRDIFTNVYYINDTAEDRRCSGKIKTDIMNN